MFLNYALEIGLKLKDNLLKWYNNIFSHNYFWRTYDQKEIDRVEDREGKLFAYKFKRNEKIVTCPKLFTQTYPDSEFACINTHNYLSFIT